jgi:hypothetical protein
MDDESYKQLQARHRISCRNERVLRLLAQQETASPLVVAGYETFRRQHAGVCRELAKAQAERAFQQASVKPQEELVQAFIDALNRQNVQAIERQQEEMTTQQTFEHQMDSPIMREIEETARAYMSNPKSVKEQFLTKQERTNSSSAAGKKHTAGKTSTKESGPFSFSSDKDDPTLDLSEEL